jgi:hypothetical protein
MAESKKIGRGKNQPSRQMYKAVNRSSINAKKRAAHRSLWENKKDSQDIDRGAIRRERRAKWLSSCPTTADGKRVAFADYERRIVGVSKHDFEATKSNKSSTPKSVNELTQLLAA